MKNMINALQQAMQSGSNSSIVGAFNALAVELGQKPVKKFRDKETAVKRAEALLAMMPEEQPVEPAEADETKSAKSAKRGPKADETPHELGIVAQNVSRGFQKELVDFVSKNGTVSRQDVLNHFQKQGVSEERIKHYWYWSKSHGILLPTN